MRNIVVSKFGNEPDIFGNSLRVGMIGDWETKKLLQVLSSDKDNNVIYYGKAKWDDYKANMLFSNKNVKFIQSTDTDDFDDTSDMLSIDEFHIILGPHAIYNAGVVAPSWESIKTSLVTQRMLERVAPQIKLINKNLDAKCFFYLSDRRFLLMASDIMNDNITILAQTIAEKTYNSLYMYSRFDYTSIDTVMQDVTPFRFETLWLVGKNPAQFKANMEKDHEQCKVNLVIPANQVTSDDEVYNSRFSKILDYTKYIDDFVIAGKWTQPEVRHALDVSSKSEHYLDGLDMTKYNKLLLDSKYALVLFNTTDSVPIFENNWITVKFWECIYNGCITFVEASQVPDIPFIPKELQVCTGKELRDKLKKCEEDITYKNKLKELQLNLVKPEYFSHEYFTNEINKYRRN